MPRGARKRLLKAIAARSAGGPAGEEIAAAPSREAVVRQAERRRLTVMFVDLVGSTQLAARLDPEDMSALIRAYQNAVAGEITRFEGHIAKYMGDGVLAYFGWPRAHEDAAERAVRAGPALNKALASLEASAGQRLESDLANGAPSSAAGALTRGSCGLPSATRLAPRGELGN